MTLRWLALGDSYTIGEGVDPAGRWPAQALERLRVEFPSLAAPEIVATTGWTTDELAAGIAAAAPQGPYDLVTLLIGVNDQYRGRPVTEFAERFRPLLAQAVAFAGGAERVVVVSIPDWGVSPFAADRHRGDIAAAIDTFNAAKRAEATRAGAAWVDVTTLSRIAGPNPSMYADDGVHPSAASYARWVPAIVAAAARVLRGEPAAASIAEHHIRVQRTARWCSVGAPTPAVRTLWVVMHGYAQLAREILSDCAALADERTMLVAPEGLSRFYAEPRPGRADPSPRVGASWMTREDRDAEILDYIDLIDTVVERAAAMLPEPPRIAVLGFSQGAATASRWVALGRFPVDRVVLWGGAPADDLDADVLRERLGGRPMILVHGERDRIVKRSAIDAAIARWDAASVPVRLHGFDGGHRIDAAVLRVAAAGEGA